MRPGSVIAVNDGTDFVVREPIDGQLCMEGRELVRHFLQQAQLHAAFLPGGKNHGTVVEDHVLTPEEAADALRGDLHDALEALKGLA